MPQIILLTSFDQDVGEIERSELRLLTKPMAVGVVGGISAMTTDVVPALVVPKPRRRLRESTPVLLVEDSPFNFGVAIEIRRREALCGNHTPIVALMARVVEDGRRRCLVVGMDDYLAKPFTLEQMRTVLTKWLKVAAAATREQLSLVAGSPADSDR